MPKNIKKRVFALESKNQFQPKWYAIFFNPYFITRRHLFKRIKLFSQNYADNKKILDVGCGKKPYKNLFQKDDYIGIDIKGGGHSDSRKIVDKFYDGQNIPYDDCMFDIVISTEVFEHVEYPEKLLKEVYRTLKNDGVLFLTMPFVWNEHEIPYDFRRFTTFEHKRLLKRNNFKLISIESTTGVFGTCGQLISGFLIENFSRIVNNQKILFRGKYSVKKIFILFICFPVQLIFLLLDLVFGKKGIALNYVITAQKKNSNLS